MGPSPVQGSGGGLRAQLDSTENKLAACLHCATANTPEGKAQIQALSLRVQALKARIQEVETAKANRASPLIEVSASPASNQDQGRAPAGLIPSGLSPLGGSLDVKG